MATTGGSGTFVRPPGDDDVAPVIPLRQRHSEPSDASTSRKRLPRERAAFDPELEPADVDLRRRRPRAALGRIRQATARRPRRAMGAAALVLALAGGATAAISDLGSTSSPRRPHVAASSVTGDAPQAMDQASALRASSTRLAQLQHVRRSSHRLAPPATRVHAHHAHRPTTKRPNRASSGHAATSLSSHSTSSSASLPAQGTNSYSSHTSTSVSNAEPARTASAPASTQTATQPPGPSGPGGAVGSSCNPKCP
jgi:hypothetical protein